MILSLCLTALAQAGVAPSEPGRIERYAHTVSGLDAPSAVAVAADGSLWITESFSGRLVHVGADGNTLAELGELGLLEPTGIALAPDGSLFVSDAGRHCIVHVSASGEVLGSFGELGVEPGQLHAPRGLAATADLVVVCDERNERIQVFAHDGTPQLAFGSYGTGADQFARPVDVALDAEGRIYVVDADLHRVQVFTPGGEHELTFGDWGFFPGLLSTPSALDVADGKVFVADTENQRIQVFGLDGEFDYQWGVHAIRPREGKGKLHYPGHLAVAQDGSRAALVEALDDRVQVFERGAPRNPLADRIRQRTGQPAPHYGFDMHASGVYMAVVEPETHSIRIFDLQWTEPRMISRVGGYGASLGLFRRPSGLFLDGATRSMLVCDSGNRRLQWVELRVDPADEVVFNPELARFVQALDFQILGRDFADVPLRWNVVPVAVCQDLERGEIYVLDERNARVFVFDSEARFLRSFGGHGSEPGRFAGPTAIAIDAERERVFVTELHNRRLQVLGRDGTALATWTGSPEIPFIAPHGVALRADGTVVVADAGTHVVTRLDEDGKSVQMWGGKGIQRGEFYKPRSVAFSASGDMFVLDHANHRGQVFEPNGNFQGAFGSRLYTKPARLPQTYNPEDYRE